MKKLIILTILAGLILLRQFSVYAETDKITICHATGLLGTDHFVTLELPFQAVYGQAGHFNENGTTQAGHEEDYLGPCIEPTIGITPTGVSDIPTPTITPSVTPTITVAPSPTGIAPTGVQPTGEPKAGEPLPQGANQPALQGRGNPETAGIK